MTKPKEIDYAFRIDHKKLWALDLPVEDIMIKDLSDNFSIPYLEKEGTDDWNLTISDLLDNLNDEPSHAEKMEKSDLKYPIDIYFYRNSWIILDGIHRLAKSISLGREKIKVRKIPEDQIEKIKKQPK